VQEVLVWAWQHLGELLSLPAGESAALRQRVLHDTADKIAREQERWERRQQRVAARRSLAAQQAPASECELLETEWRQMLQGALDGLPGPFRDALAGHFFDDLTWKQVGARLGCTERHARRLGNQALSVLRGMLEGRV
jgi:DNA-directed RNA polymerase specialized sigma24 family protein